MHPDAPHLLLVDLVAHHCAPARTVLALRLVSRVVDVRPRLACLARVRAVESVGVVARARCPPPPRATHAAARAHSWARSRRRDDETPLPVSW